MNNNNDTKIVGRIHCEWYGGGSDSGPVFEGDIHEFNSNGLKRHLIELATGNYDQKDKYTYQIYTDNGLQDCTLAELFKVVYPDVYVGGLK